MPRQRIAVIGAGPKGAAIAAKAWCLNQHEHEIEVTIFDRHRPGAFWRGDHGYTDGDQRLCTPAERDLGFPYTVDPELPIAEHMQQKFSWQAFLVSEAHGGRYSDWLNHGRLPPLHRDFADYLKFAIDRSKALTVTGDVKSVQIQNGLWKLKLTDGTMYPADGGYDGLVVTGPGPAKRVVKLDDRRLFDGVDFWKRDKDRKAAIDGLGSLPVVIIGGGGTAAAVTAWFLRNNHRKLRIILLNSQAMLFTRTSNFFESNLFDDEETWKGLKPDERSAFAARLNRGVVWETITSLLSDAENLSLVPGRANGITLGEPEGEAVVGPLTVGYANNVTSKGQLPAGMVIDATGFDEWAFSGLLPPAVRKQTRSTKKRKTLITGIKEDLSLNVADAPRLHAPNLSEMIGPGYQSLMVLGAMADKVLGPYRAASRA